SAAAAWLLAAHCRSIWRRWREAHYLRLARAALAARAAAAAGPALRLAAAAQEKGRGALRQPGHDQGGDERRREFPAPCAAGSLPCGARAADRGDGAALGHGRPAVPETDHRPGAGCL